jgi:outer membrane protein TolC
MSTIHRMTAVLCVALLVASTAPAQAPASQKLSQGGFGSAFTNPYRWEELAPIDLANSTRLESLLRAGNIYLSLQDAIALALENNLDIQYQRYTPMSSEASLLRAEAGGPLRGVPTGIQTATTSGLSQVTGTGEGSGGASTGGGAGGGGSRGGGGGDTGSQLGTIITATGTTVPNLDPELYFVGQAGHITSPQTNSFTTGTNALVLTNKVLNYGIQKSFITGTSIQFGANNANRSSNAYRIDFNPYTNASASLTITQRLLQGFGLAVNNRYIRVAKNNRRISDLTFRQQIIATVSQIVSGYWDLVSFNENVKVRRQALELAEKLYEDNKKQVEIGTLAPIEIVRAEAEVATARQQLVNAETALLQQETLMKNALSKTGVASPTLADARIIPTDRITVPEQETVTPIQDLTAEAFQKRPDLAQASLNIENAKISLAGSKSQLRPSLDVQAQFQNNGLAGQPNAVPIPPGDSFFQRGQVDPFLVGGYGTAMSQIFARNFPDYSVAFQLVIPLRNRAAKGDMVIDQVNLRQAEIRQQQMINGVRADVRNALIALQQARAGYQAAVKARVLQEQTLDAEQKKYALGASTIFFVIQAQRDLAQARSAEVAAESAYAKSKVQLDAATGRTLDVNNISIEEAMAGRVSRPPSALPVLQQ